jgi:muramoyltetrapeptide carboxypeptidase
MIQPKFLQAGDSIGIFAPARKISDSEVLPAIKIIEKAGFRVKLAPGLFAADRQFAGDDASRASDLQSLINDPDIRAILCARGGYGTVRILAHIDWNRLIADPKWIIGYSDVTVLHSHIQRHLKMQTIHGPMPVNFTEEGNELALQSLWDLLSGKMQQYRFPHHPLNRTGDAEGLLCGGNLSVLCSLLGSPSDLEVNGKILFLEDLDEYLYHIDRMMMNLKRNGWFERISGLLVGGLTDMNDNAIPFGRNAEEIIREAVDAYAFPVAFGFPAGHLPDNRAMRMGGELKMKVCSAEGETIVY